MKSFYYTYLSRRVHPQEESIYKCRKGPSTVGSIYSCRKGSSRISRVHLHMQEGSFHSEVNPQEGSPIDGSIHKKVHQLQGFTQGPSTGMYNPQHPSFFGGVKFKLDDHEKTQWGVIVGTLGTSKHLRNKSFMEPFFTSGFCWQP